MPRQGWMIKIVATGAGAISVGVILLAVWNSIHLSKEESRSLRIARQVVSQVQAVALEKKSDRHSKEPYLEATRLLSRGDDTRTIHIELDTDLPREPEESWEMNGSEGYFELARVLAPETSEGVRVRIAIERRSLFSTGGTFVADVAWASLVVLLWLSFYALWVLVAEPQRPIATSEPVTHPSTAEVPPVVVSEMREALKQSGLAVKTLLSATRELVNGAARSRDAIASASRKIRERPIQAKVGLEKPRSISRGALDAEVESLRHLVELTRLMKDPKAVLDYSGRLHESAGKLVRVAQEIQRNMESEQTKPGDPAADVEFALGSLEAVLRDSAALDEKIQQTSQSLIGQAKVLQKMQATTPSLDATSRRVS